MRDTDEKTIKRKENAFIGAPIPFGSRGDCLTCGMPEVHHIFVRHPFRSAPLRSAGSADASPRKRLVVESPDAGTPNYEERD